MIVTDLVLRGRAGGWSGRSLDVILQLGHVRGQVGAADPPRPADLDARQGPVLQQLEDTAPGDPQLGRRLLRRQEHGRGHGFSNREPASQSFGSRLVVPYGAARRKRVPRVSSTVWRISL